MCDFGSLSCPIININLLIFIQFFNIALQFIKRKKFSIIQFAFSPLGLVLVLEALYHLVMDKISWLIKAQVYGMFQMIGLVMYGCRQKINQQNFNNKSNNRIILIMNYYYILKQKIMINSMNIEDLQQLKITYLKHKISEKIQKIYHQRQRKHILSIFDQNSSLYLNMTHKDPQLEFKLKMAKGKKLIDFFIRIKLNLNNQKKKWNQIDQKRNWKKIELDLNQLQKGLIGNRLVIEQIQQELQKQKQELSNQIQQVEQKFNQQLTNNIKQQELGKQKLELANQIQLVEYNFNQQFQKLIQQQQNQFKKKLKNKIISIQFKNLKGNLNLNYQLLMMKLNFKMVLYIERRNKSYYVVLTDGKFSRGQESLENFSLINYKQMTNQDQELTQFNIHFNWLLMIILFLQSKLINQQRNFHLLQKVLKRQIHLLLILINHECDLNINACANIKIYYPYVHIIYNLKWKYLSFFFHFDLSLNRSKIVNITQIFTFNSYNNNQNEVNIISFHCQLNQYRIIRVFPYQKISPKQQISERLFNSHLHSPQHDQQRGSCQHQRKIIFLQIQVPQENMNQKHLIIQKYEQSVEKMEYIKLLKFDEKFLSNGQYSRNYVLMLKCNYYQGKTQQRTRKQQIMINLCYIIIKITKKLNFNKQLKSIFLEQNLNVITLKSVQQNYLDIRIFWIQMYLYNVSIKNLNQQQSNF
ncbi:unnamed protein product [Paramecium pentaurelia]|uniref:Transmembrane protein n=1 Tax=Paramecium pentaurelia TaxID=43138 RepID=A0A8S1SZT7_9CILI|nr:unnamed protein product [Paramecium pentaurelia]